MFSTIFSSWSLYVLAVLAVVGWFAIGTQYNIRRGNQALQWLQEGLKLLGERSTLRWLGSSVVELKIQNANPPFRQAEVLIVLEPRDVPFLWWYHHARGRRDLLIFRGQLCAAPGFEFEALDRRCWSTRGIEQQVHFRNWKPVPLPPPSPLVAYAAGDAPAASELLDLPSLPGCPFVRLAMRRSQPNLELQWKLDDVRKVPARNLFERLRSMVQSLAVGH